MKSLTGLWSELAHDCATRCNTNPSRDIITMLARVDHEGDSFLTITLPSFASDFERSLELGYVPSDAFFGFKKRQGLPVFLRGFLYGVFDKRTAVVLDKVDAECVRSIRQLCLLYKKVEFPTTPARDRKAAEKYKDTEIALKQVEAGLSDENVSSFALAFRTLYSSVLNSLTREIEGLRLEMRHGPGSVQDRLRGNQKFDFPTWTTRLEPLFPYGFYCSHNWAAKPWPRALLRPEFEPPVKVVFVPKTQKTPRVIAMEPAHMQYVQQGIMAALVPLLEGCEFGKSQGFSDQEPNRALAREGSISGRLSTIDLSEASDRVLNSLVVKAMSPWPTASDAIQACRSTRSRLEDGTVVELSKFASMGSALCFPIEVMVFSAIVLVGLRRAGYALPAALELFRQGEVRVYGDDIIVPTDSVQFVEDSLEAFGLLVNRSKSFSRGKFRESCGGDYFAGEWVTPVRVRQDSPKTIGHVKELVSWSATANQLWHEGYERASEYMHRTVEAIVGLYPAIGPNSSLLGRVSHAPQVDRFNARLFRAEVKGFEAQRPALSTTSTDCGRLFKTLRWRWEDPTQRDHLVRGGRSSSYTLKKRWSLVG